VHSTLFVQRFALLSNLLAGTDSAFRIVPSSIVPDQVVLISPDRPAHIWSWKLGAEIGDVLAVCEAIKGAIQTCHATRERRLRQAPNLLRCRLCGDSSGAWPVLIDAGTALYDVLCLDCRSRK